MIVAIYSRKSKFTGKGDSIENQIEMCKNHINTTLPGEKEFIVYEDEGFSGGNINRPQFKKLMEDVKSKKINLLICYRLDRISRNVSDFSSILETLQENKVEFISIKEQFDTSSPMGRAMIYIASVFSQLERETIAERIKDNMLEMAKNGKWTGGRLPLGFKSKKTSIIDSDGKKRSSTSLIHDTEDLKFVKFLYEKYLELGSLHKLEVYTHESNIKSSSGRIFEKSSLKLILQNPIYVKANSSIKTYLESKNMPVYGDIDDIHSLLTYNKTETSYKNGKITKRKKEGFLAFAAVSNIIGYLEPELWLKVQLQFDKNRESFPRLGKTHNTLLTGKLFCGYCNSRMIVRHGQVSPKTGLKRYYYTCYLKNVSHKKLCTSKNINATILEDAVIKTLKELNYDRALLLDTLNRKSTSLDANQDKLIELNNSLVEKKKQIDVLLTKLSLDVDGSITDILFDKIKSLKTSTIRLENDINSIKKENLSLNNSLLDIFLLKNFIEKCSYMDDFSNIEKKKIINSLVESIYYYSPDESNNISIKINFIGSSSKNSPQK